MPCKNVTNGRRWPTLANAYPIGCESSPNHFLAIKIQKLAKKFSVIGLYRQGL